MKKNKLIPKGQEGLLTTIKKRLYNNIIPSGYHNPVKRVWDAVVNNKQETAYDMGVPVYRNTKIGNKEDLKKLQSYNPFQDTFTNGVNTNDLRNALWAKYLGLSDEEVGFKISDYIEESPYKPPHAKPGEVYYRFNPKLVSVLNAANVVTLIPKTIKKPNPYKGKYNPFTPDSIEIKYRPIEHTTIKNLPEGFLATADGWALGTYTIGQGVDENGKYTSYYDEWNINPFSGKSAKTHIPFISDLDDISIIGTPIKLYDRIYELPDSTEQKDKYNKQLIEQLKK